MNVAPIRKALTHEVVQGVGTVSSIDGADYLVENEDGTFRAARAVCCLVEPVERDEVLFAGRMDGELFVLGVLRRIAGQPTTISTQGDTRFNIRNGRLSLVAREGIDLVTTKVLALASRELKVNAIEGDVWIDKLAYLGRKALAEVEAIKVFADVLDTVAERVSQKAKQSFKFIEVIDQIRSKQIDYKAEETLGLRGHNTMIFADLLTKIDSDQIQLG
jgi:hypothetical protein